MIWNLSLYDSDNIVQWHDSRYEVTGPHLSVATRLIRPSLSRLYESAGLVMLVSLTFIHEYHEEPESL